MRKINSIQGFTLVELIITMLMSSLIMAAVMSAYTVNERVHTAQKQVVEMQQNLRAGGEMLIRDLKSAGFDPTDLAGAGITSAFPDLIAFSRDTNGDADVTDPGENIAYNLYTTANGDMALGRTTSPNPIVVNNPSANHWEAVGQQAAAENIEAIEFLYTLANGTQLTNPTPTQYGGIVAVEVSILARASFVDREFNNNTLYTPASNNNFALNGANPPNDNFRRRMITQFIKLRNLP